MMVFFLSADEQIYHRYGGRDGKNADNRQSLPGLHYAMEAALAAHDLRQKSAEPAYQRPDKPTYLSDLASNRRMGRGCMHCHQVKEALNLELERTGKWTRDRIWRYPLPENLGFVLEVDRGNVIERVEPGTAAESAGLKPGDVVTRLGNVAIASFGDAQHALDRASKSGTIEIAFRRGEQPMEAKLELADGWRRTDISWRASSQRYVPSPRLYGRDLPVKEKEALGLSAKQMAFRQEDSVHSQARDAGVKVNDIILGFDQRFLEMDAGDFQSHVRSTYIRGDKVTVNVLRDGKRLDFTMTLR